MMQQPAEKPSPRYNWSEVWTAIITKPRIETFHEILADPAANPRRAYIWMYLTGCVSLFVALYSMFSNPEVQSAMIEMAPELASNFGSAVLTSLLCTVPLAAGFGVIFFIVFAGIIHFAAMQIDRKLQLQSEKFKQWLYVMGAILAPLNLISLIFVIAPFLSFLSIVALGYQIFLMVLGARTVYGFDMRQASIIVLIPMAALFVLLLLFIG